jgi:hypothetical protein
LTASFRERPKPLPNKLPPFGLSSSSAALGSALKVVPRTKGVAPKADVPSFLADGGGNAVSVSIDTSGVLEAKLPPTGLLKTLVDPLALLPPRDPKPPLLAKPAKPPDAGEMVDAPLPKTLPEVGLALPKADWPNAGVAADVPDADAQGDGFAPNPKDGAWPKAGAAGLPNAGAPKAGAPKAGVAAGLLPKADEPKLGVAVLEADAHGEGLDPRAGAPPKAGVVLAGVPNGDAVEAAGVGDPNAGAGVLELVG